MNLKAFAKANLILKVIGEENKYHLLQMLNVRINVFDEITINVNKKKTDVLKYENTNLDPNKDDLIIRALNLFRKSFDIDEYYDIVVKKEIPIGVGLGWGYFTAKRELFESDRTLREGGESQTGG